MKSFLVDYHCHIDLYPDYSTVFNDCENEKIHTLAVTTTPKAWPKNIELAAKMKFVHVALGLHPQLVHERAEEIQLWEAYLPQARYIGEVGLDAGPRFYKNIDLQKTVFKRILQACAEAGDKILSVHSARAASVVLDMIEKHLPNDRGRVVLHWFTGNGGEIRRAIDLGCFFSINMSMLINTKSRDLYISLPMDRILTETDGPFVKHEGHPAHPRDSLAVIELLSQVNKAAPESIASAIWSNVCRIEGTT